MGSGLALAAASLSLASPAAAHWQGAQLGMTLQDVEVTYPEGQEQIDGRSGMQRMVLPPLQFGGVAWSGAVLSFDATRKLKRISFVVQGQDFDALKSRLATRLQAPRSDAGAVTVASGVSSAVQFRICQMSDSTIEVTYEAAWDNI